MAHVLIVDDDKPTCNFLTELIQNIGHSAESAHSLADGMRKGLSGEFDTVFLDVRLPDGNGLDLLPRLKELPVAPEVIIMTGQGDPDGVELAIRNGAWDYLQKPLSPKKILLPLKRVLQYRDNLAANMKPQPPTKRAGIVGESFALKKALNSMWEAARSDAAVLITGETGTGKELFARALHENSPRSTKRFVTVDCAAIPENLIESTLFGHVKGAFTGADQASGGLIREADGGTLFLDEIGELPLESQRKFLRVLQEKKFRPVGGRDEVYSDFRLVAATNQNLNEMAAHATFRSDLLYRLQTMTIHLPPLRERLEDLELLTEHFNSRIAERYRTALKKISPEALEILKEHQWTGNIRELAGTLESAFIAASNEPLIFQHHLPERLRTAAIQSRLNVAEQTPVSEIETLYQEPHSLTQDDKSATPPTYKDFKQDALSRLEYEYLNRVLTYTNWNINQACEITGLGRSRLYSLLKKHEISR
ncbi:sigma-54 dependent transcriptional regulator [Desulfovibrio sp. JC022]|uniref:sigma-54-dependent transcriptional regulator n=1 Tax=Desulfovibrio sp. JC022 TaxID=2593642 RepID=UPI0013D74A2B|nr:sigma-54 dependent transcriptional regulator [Desulfovibrio sp. JC022]NDV23321.1 sigma-54-dependent Fis family transcriptional regulator [Desulfovibrio sp. JC022]